MIQEINNITINDRIYEEFIKYEGCESALKLIENSYHELTSSTYEDDYDVYRMKFISLRDRKILKYYIDNYE